MKKIALFILTVLTISCTQDKQETGAAEMKGQWKTLEVKVNRTQPIHDVNCDAEKKGIADLYALNPDGSFTIKDICSGKLRDIQKNTWKFEDHILSLKYVLGSNETKAVYSVVEMGDKKVKWKLLYTRYNGEYTLEDIGYYLIMEKQ